jgi:hypothetical protein
MLSSSSKQVLVVVNVSPPWGISIPVYSYLMITFLPLFIYIPLVMKITFFVIM